MPSLLRPSGTSRPALRLITSEGSTVILNRLQSSTLPLPSRLRKDISRTPLCLLSIRLETDTGMQMLSPSNRVPVRFMSNLTGRLTVIS